MWEIGVYPVMFGYRVRAGRVAVDWCAVDYCAGRDDTVLKKLVVLVTIILESFDESVTESQIEAILPWCKVKPINNDTCWDALVKLAAARSLA